MVKRILVLTMVLGLLMGSVAVADAAKKKKKKKAKPVETTLYMHGNYAVGDLIEWASEVAEGTSMVMDTQEPAGGPPKSMAFGPPGVGNALCTGNSLFPSWQATVAGTIVDKVTWHVHVASAPATVIARLWVDVPFGSCTSAAAGVDDFVEPVATVEVSVPPGHSELEVVFEDLGKLQVRSNMIVQIHRPADTNQGRILYDSADMASHVVFNCIPAGKAKACAE